VGDNKSMDIDKIAKNVGNTIKFHRKQSKLTQLGLAKLAGVGKVVVFDIEHGKPTCQIDTLLKILNALNIQFKLQSPLMEVYEKQKATNK
jgi:HTH-type transcriptional regulator/antitoxin HipB